VVLDRAAVGRRHHRSGRYAAGAGAGDLGFAQCADRAGEVRGVPDVVRGGGGIAAAPSCPGLGVGTATVPHSFPRLRGGSYDLLLPPACGGRSGWGQLPEACRARRNAACPHPSPPPRRGGGSLRLLLPPLAGREPPPALLPPLAGGGRDGGDRRRGAARCVWYLRPLPGFVPVTMLQTSHRVLRACVLLLSAFLLSSCAGHPQPGESQAAGDGATTRAGAAHTGEYPNLFVEAGYPRDVVDARIEAAFAQLFHGDPDSEAVYYEAGGNEHGPLAYIH